MNADVLLCNIFGWIWWDNYLEMLFWERSSLRRLDRLRRPERWVILLLERLSWTRLSPSIFSITEILFLERLSCLRLRLSSMPSILEMWLSVRTRLVRNLWLLRHERWVMRLWLKSAYSNASGAGKSSIFSSRLLLALSCYRCFMAPRGLRE